jgi:tRNA nucleotidyltransferase (CCA-adding enzyme)
MARIFSEETGKGISHYITRWRDIKPDINGADLIALGLKPGPLFRDIMRNVLSHKLDGKVTSREEQLLLAKKLAGVQSGKKIGTPPEHSHAT